MQKSKTTIILGAGSSNDYGFPTGAELWDEIYNLLPTQMEVQKNEVSNQNLLNRVQLGNENLDAIRKDAAFVKEFMRDTSFFPSIDSLITHPNVKSKTWAVKILKTLLYSIIERFEHKALNSMNDLNFKKSSKWINFFIANYCRDFSQNDSYNFINFNYDRLFDFNLKREFLLATLSDPSHSELLISKNYDQFPSDDFDKIKIIHPYGVLGSLKEKRFGSIEETESNYSQLISNIHVIDSERINNTDPFEEAKKILDHSNKIVFLGFGFDPVNIDRLGLTKSNNQNRRFYFSCKGWTDSEIDFKVVIPLKITDGNLISRSRNSKVYGLIDFMRHSGCFNM